MSRSHSPCGAIFFWCSLILSTPITFADVLILSDGQVLKGEILQISLDKVTIQVEQAQLTIPVDRLAEVSLDIIYREHFKHANDFEAIVKLTDFCERFDLLTQGISCYRKGLEDKKLTEEQRDFLTKALEKLENEDAKRRFQNALALYEKKDWETAQAKFSQLQKAYPQLIYGEEAQKMLAQIDQQQAQEKAKAPEKEDPKKEKKRTREELFWQKKQEEAQKALVIVNEKNIEGLQFQAKEKYQKGANAYEVAENMLTYAEEVGTALVKQGPNETFQKEGQNLLEQVKTKRLIVYLNFAHLWAVSLNFNKATLYVNRILAVHPEHEEAKQLRLKITEEQIRRNK